MRLFVVRRHCGCFYQSPLDATTSVNDQLSRNKLLIGSKRDPTCQAAGELRPMASSGGSCFRLAEAA